MSLTTQQQVRKLPVDVLTAFPQKAVAAAHHDVKDEGASPTISETRMAREGVMLLPLASHLGYSRIAGALQRLKLMVWHLGERHNPLDKKCLGIAPRCVCGLVKVCSYVLLVGPPSVLKVSCEILTLGAVQLLLQSQV
jgi:hypothetical protein